MKHNWEYKRLGDVCSIKTGKLDANAKVENGRYPFFTCDAKPYKIDTYAFDSEAILISGNGSNVGHVHYYNGKFNAYQRTYVLSNLRYINPHYLVIFFKGFLRSYIYNKKKGGCIPYITLPMLTNFPIPVPPREVQERIVAELDKINEVIEDCREMLRKLDALAQSLFYDYFGDPVTNPKGWETMPFEKCLCKVKYPAKLNTKEYATSGAYPIVSQEENLICGYTDRFDCVFAVHKPIVVFGDHTRCLKFIDFDFALGADGVKILYPINSICSRFFYYSLFLFKIPSLGYSRHYRLLKELNIPVPPLVLQEEFAERIERIEAQKKAVEQTIAELQTLLDSRMDYWFN